MQLSTLQYTKGCIYFIKKRAKYLSWLQFATYTKVGILIYCVYSHVFKVIHIMMGRCEGFLRTSRIILRIISNDKNVYIRFKLMYYRVYDKE